MALKHADLIKKMTLEEKASLCDGLDYWHTKPIERLGIPSISLHDGPHGVRKKPEPEEAAAIKAKAKAEGKSKEKKSALAGIPTVCFPTAATTSCSWDPELIEKMGEALGKEARAEHTNILLGPGANIKRTPVGGRNFEYFSEDPELAGEISAAYINGVQSKGVGTSMKHFAANNQETRRMSINTVVDERTLREVYLRPFEIAVKKAQPWTVMNAYNRLNNEYCGENKWLLTDVLRKDWGFKGLVETDWGAENDRVLGLLAGQELEMPTSSGQGTKRIVEAVENGELDVRVLNRAVDKILDLVDKCSEVTGKKFRYDAKKHHAFARKVATQSMVLLKNEDNILPLSPDAKITVIGEMAQKPRYQGAGSSVINPVQLDNAIDALTERGANFKFAPGYSTDKKNKISDESFIDQAVKKARGADVVLMFIGLTDAYETEGCDRKNIDLPELHNKLVEAVLSVNRNVVVVLSAGSVVSMPWADDVKGILHTFLSGEATGSATCDVLFGDVNPSGKLSETYPYEYSDNPSYKYFPGTEASVEYREGIYVGYRYYDKANIPVRFPFGYGLSYTTFEYSDIQLSADTIKDEDTLTVTYKVTNTGSIAGAEITQLYVADVESTIFRPVKELKGFKKVFLEPGETKEVCIELDKRAFAFYNVLSHDWQVETGEFKILVGASSRDIKLAASVTVYSTCADPIPDYRAVAPAYYTADVNAVDKNQFKAVLGHKIPSRKKDYTQPFTPLNSLEDGRNYSRWGKRIYKLLSKFLPEGTMGNAVALQSPVKVFGSMSFGVMTPGMLDALLDIFNKNRFWRSLGKIIFRLFKDKGLKNISKLSTI